MCCKEIMAQQGFLQNRKPWPVETFVNQHAGESDPELALPS